MILSRFRYGVLLGAALGLGALFAAGGVFAGNDKPNSLVGKPAPSFELVQPDGRPLSLGSALQSGRAVLVNMWGIRCGACLVEMKHLNVLHKKYRDEGLRIIGINVDGVGAASLRDYMAGMEVRPEYPVVADPKMSAIDSYRMEGAPLTIFIDKAGVVVERHEGFSEGDEKQIEAIIRKTLEMK